MKRQEQLYAVGAVASVIALFLFLKSRGGGEGETRQLAFPLPLLETGIRNLGNGGNGWSGSCTCIGSLIRLGYPECSDCSNGGNGEPEPGCTCNPLAGNLLPLCNDCGPSIDPCESCNNPLFDMPCPQSCGGGTNTECSCDALKIALGASRCADCPSQGGCTCNPMMANLLPRCTDCAPIISGNCDCCWNTRMKCPCPMDCERPAEHTITDYFSGNGAL